VKAESWSGSSGVAKEGHPGHVGEEVGRGLGFDVSDGWGKNGVVVFEVLIRVEGRWWGSRLGFL